MRRSILAVACAGLAFGAVTAAAEGVAEEGSGTLVTRDLAVTGFTAIEVPGTWEVAVRRGPYAVQVTVDDNLIDDLRVERHGDALRFGLRPQVSFRRVTLRAQVTMPTLDAIRVSGSGGVTFSGFEAGTLDLRVSGSGDVNGTGIAAGALQAEVAGSGDITLDGCATHSAAVSVSGSGSVTLNGAAGGPEAETLALRISGSGDADLRGCTFSGAEVRISGSGQALLELGDGDFTGSLSGSGSVTYRGSPSRVDVRTSGSGRVIKAG